jgi:glycosyltransferase involved in cell wall biosynthesis
MPVVVSAIMAAYNTAAVIAEAIDSILAQTFTDWELIVVDDASTDETAAIVRGYQDPRISLYTLPRNQGRGAARNVALRHARGRYIAIADSDDISLPQRFAVEVAYLESHPDVAVVACQMQYFWDDVPPQDGLRFPEDPDEIQRRFDRGQMAISHGAALIRAECFQRHGGYLEDCRRAQDLEFFLRIRRDCAFRTLPETMYLYRHEIRPVSLHRWLEMAGYRRYAVYRAAAAQAGSAPPLAFAEFSRRPSYRLNLYSLEMLRFIRYAVLKYTWPSRQLK